jgi:hypothetical protein
LIGEPSHQQRFRCSLRQIPLVSWRDAKREQPDFVKSRKRRRHNYRFWGKPEEQGILGTNSGKKKQADGVLSEVRSVASGTNGLPAPKDQSLSFAPRPETNTNLSFSMMFQIASFLSAIWNM